MHVEHDTDSESAQILSIPESIKEELGCEATPGVDTPNVDGGWFGFACYSTLP